MIKSILRRTDDELHKMLLKAQILSSKMPSISCIFGELGVLILSVEGRIFIYLCSQALTTMDFKRS